MKHYAETDADSRVLGLLGVVGDDAPTSQNTITELVGWNQALPSKPSAKCVLFLRSGALAFEDPRSPAQAWADVRAERDTLLAASDWTVTRAVETGSSLPTAWSTYRQALRDITEQQDPFNINWPTPPAS